MPGRAYDDFDLLIEKSGDAYRARVQQSPAGEGEAEFQLPLPEAEIQKLLPRLAWSRRGRHLRRPTSARTEDVRHFGERLFRAVFKGEVEARFRRSLDLTSGPDQGLRLRLHFNGVPELARLPWEYLYDPQRSYLGLAEETPIVRYPELPRPVRPLQVELPLRVLVVIANPEGTAPLDVEEEWRQIHEALADLISRGLLLLECLASPTLEELNARLRRQPCHVLHFIGHGIFDRDLAQGSLVFADENGQKERVSGEDLAAILTPQKISLAVLNACEGARHAEADAFAGVAQALVQREIPAVVAMQAEITDKAAISFAKNFYQLLAEYFPIDGALAETRKAMFAARHNAEWGTPVLYMRSPNGRLFSPPEEPPSRRRRALVARAPWIGLLVLLALAGGYAVYHQARREPEPAPRSVEALKAMPETRSPSSPSPPPAVRPPAPVYKIQSKKEGKAEAALPPTPRECPSPPGTDIRFVKIPGGHFSMGSQRKDEKPIHEVTITHPFCLEETEVTERQWRQVMVDPRSSRQANDTLPAATTWNEAQLFIRKLNDRAGRPLYRLPSEAEWEYAARAGSPSRYSFGDDPSQLDLYGNYLSNGRRDRAPVCSFKRNPWGLCDLYGNAWEWVQDYYGEYNGGAVVDPQGPAEGKVRVRRGGSFNSNAEGCRSASRSHWPPDRRSKENGFRIVQSVEGAE